MIEVSSSTGLSVRTLSHGAAIEYHVTALASPDAPAGEAAEALFGQVVDVVADHGFQPIQEKVFGREEAREVIATTRRRVLASAGLDPDRPWTFVSGAPMTGAAVGGVQIWGVAPKAGRGEVRDVTIDGCRAGRCWHVDGARLLYLPAIDGLPDIDGSWHEGAGRHGDGAAAPSVTEQADRMFTRTIALLAANGFELRQTIRTWIYVARLLDWYGEFNRVRTGHYRQAGFHAETGRAFPASTGIQGRSGATECFMDVLAFQPGAVADAGIGPVVRPVITSPRQDRAFSYGSAFSRGMAVEHGPARTIYVSGTASIDSAGRTRFPGCAEEQCLDTLLNMAALLEQEGCTLADIASATLYCKDDETWHAWQNVSRLLGVTSFPTVSVRADVCRDNLMVELEAVAITPGQGNAGTTSGGGL